MKSMSDEIVNLETVKAVEVSLRKSIEEQGSMTTSRINRVRNVAIGLAVVNLVLLVVILAAVVFH